MSSRSKHRTLGPAVSTCRVRDLAEQIGQLLAPAHEVSSRKVDFSENRVEAVPGRPTVCSPSESEIGLT